MMPADQAAKVLREHNAWRRRGSMDKMPHSAQAIGHAIDAAVAALEHQPKPAYCCAKCDTITERARELIGLHLSEQEGLRLPTGREYQRAVDALAKAIDPAEQSPPCADSRQPAVDSRQPNNDHEDDAA